MFSLTYLPLRRRFPRAGGAWSCAGCAFSGQPNYRYIAQGTVFDWTGQEYITFFDAEATLLLGMNANAMNGEVLRAGGDSAGLPPIAEACFQGAIFKELLLTTKAKMDDRAGGDGSARIKVTVVKMREVEPVRECRALINSLKQYIASSSGV